MMPGAAVAMPDGEMSLLPRDARDDARLREFAYAAISAVLHIAFLVVLVLAVAPKAPPKPEERPVRVEILDAKQLDALLRPPEPALPPPAMSIPSSPPDIPAPDAPAAPAVAPTVPSSVTMRPDGMLEPKRFLAMASLAGPHNKGAREALQQLGYDERVVQLCTVEALEQIAALGLDYRPDMLSPYAFAEARIAGLALTASGAAFRSRDQWYALSFKCAVTRSLDNIASFEFKPGDPIPPEEWESHNLVAGPDLEGH